MYYRRCKRTPTKCCIPPNFHGQTSLIFINYTKTTEFFITKSFVQNSKIQALIVPKSRSDGKPFKISMNHKNIFDHGSLKLNGIHIRQHLVIS